MNAEEKIPRVFISYSHDTPEHKRWVGELASKLVNNGVDVILDQWDLSLGDDLVKFMEYSLTNAGRVLMICTEPYVRKADEGKGGVGYEAMIVTGELVRDLGTSKFIPIIRQATDEIILPKSLSTRFYVNLSEGQNFDEQFERLLRELHQIPTMSKPPLGKNPFAKQPSGEEVPVDISLSSPIPDIVEMHDDILAVYRTALDIARKGDLVAWRKVIRQAKQSIPRKINEWRKIQDQNPPKNKETLPDIVLAGISPYAALFAIALAGVESGRDKFNNQISTLDEVLNPHEWNYAGYKILADFPDTSAYVYHLLHGAICLATGQIDLAVTFARTKIKEKHYESSIAVIQNHRITGWPSTLGGDCNVAWKFIRVLPEKWKWLNELFGELRDYQSYLCAYYLVLNILEFVDLVAAGNEQFLLKDDGLTLNIPLFFLYENQETLRKGYQLLLNDPAQVRNIWKKLNINDAKMSEFWPRWIYHMQKWLKNVRPWGYSERIIHKDLLNDLGF